MHYVIVIVMVMKYVRLMVMNQSLKQSISIMVVNGMVVPACLAEEIKTNMLLQKIQKFFKGQGYNVVSVWKCKKPHKTKVFFNIEFIPYLYYFVFNFKSILKVLN